MDLQLVAFIRRQKVLKAVNSVVNEINWNEKAYLRGEIHNKIANVLGIKTFQHYTQVRILREILLAKGVLPVRSGNINYYRHRSLLQFEGERHYVYLDRCAKS